MEPELPPRTSTDVIASAPEREIAGFWRRVGAILIDSILLGICGLVLGLIFSEQFMRMGGWGRLVGAAIALLYFVPLNSRLGGGHTIGKRALQIRVTDAGGRTISPGSAFVRACVLLLPFFLNGAPLSLTLQPAWQIILLGVAIFGLGGTIIYLIIFNRRTRQSLHDLVVGSYVVRMGGEEAAKPSMWRGHYAVVAIILLLTALLPIVISRLITYPGIAEALSAYNALLQEPEVSTAQVMTGREHFWGAGNGPHSVSFVDARVRLNRRVADKKAEAAKVAHIILEKDPAAANQDMLNVTLLDGWDIGIASAFTAEQFRHSPAEWRAE